MMSAVDAFTQAILDGDAALVERSIRRHLSFLFMPVADPLFPARPTLPLHLAARYGRHEAAEVLLAYGGDVTAVELPERRTALHVAAGFGHAATALILLDYGARPDARDIEGATPLHRAAAQNHAAILELLLDGGADLGARDLRGRTPLETARQYGASAAADMLRQRGAREKWTVFGDWAVALSRGPAR